MYNISEKRQKKIDKKIQENFQQLKDAVEETLLAYILTDDNSFTLKRNGEQNEIYVGRKGMYGYSCILKAKESEFEFLSLNDVVTKEMHQKYGLYQNWKFFEDADKLVDMFKRCVLGFK